MNWEKVNVPEETPNGWEWRTTAPGRTLSSTIEVTMSVEYTSNMVSKCELPSQEITIWFPPLFVMSRGYSPYRAKDVMKFKGYLKSFEPGESSAECPEATISIVPEKPA